MSDRLTQKQENFVQNLLLGLSQRDAYIKAGYSPNCSVAVIDVNACNLAKDNKVLLRIDELRTKVESNTVLTVLERRELLSTWAKETNVTDRGNINRNPNISSVAELNKMTGAYDAIKVDLTSGLEALLARLQGHKELTEGEE